MTDVSEQIRILHDEPMSRHTSWRAGGNAKQFVQAESLESLKEFLANLPDSEPLLWVGLGSNLLVRDGGFEGAVIATQGLNPRLEQLDDSHVYVGAGVADAKLARFCDRNSLSGASFFAGIPGLFGGALAMNAGAWGGETWPLVESVDTIDQQGVVRTRPASDFKTGYRHVEGPENEWFVGATLMFEQADASEDKNSDANLLNIKDLLAKRAATQPTGVASCGSVFRNPENDHAARLIESCGLKGTRIGGAVIAEKHANFIINDQSATANDIEELIELAQAEVKKQFGIELIREVKIVGKRLNKEVGNE